MGVNNVGEQFLHLFPNSPGFVFSEREAYGVLHNQMHKLTGAVGGNTGVPGKNQAVGATYCGWSSWADKTGVTRAHAADRDVDISQIWTIDTNRG